MPLSLESLALLLPKSIDLLAPFICLVKKKNPKPTIKTIGNTLTIINQNELDSGSTLVVNLNSLLLPASNTFLITESVRGTRIKNLSFSL